MIPNPTQPNPTQAKRLHSERFAKDVHKIFRRVDQRRAGKLDWNRGEIRMFMTKIFEEKDW